MSIKLDWTLPVGQTLDSVVIYRDIAPISIVALPSPLATLPGNAETFEDTTAALGKVYYYMVSLVAGPNQSYSSNYEVGHFSTTGPGPQDLMRGTWKRGFFGVVAEEEMFSWAEIKAQCGFTTAPSQSKTNGWLKLAYNGKVLFWPLNAYTNAMSFKEIYDRGCALGEDTVGTFPPGWSPAGYNTVQNKKITRDGFEFLVRLPRPADKTKYYKSFAELGVDEIGDLMPMLTALACGGETQAGRENLYDLDANTPFGSVGGFYSTSHVLVLNSSWAASYAAPTANSYYRPLLEFIP